MNISIFDLDCEEGSLQIGFICFERQVSFQRLASILYDEHRYRLQSIDALVLRPAVDVQIKDPAEKSSEVKFVIERFPHLPIHLLFSSKYRIQLSGNLNESIDSVNDRLKTPNAEKLIASIRQRELEGFILNSASIFRSPKNTIYRTPSNEYTHAFVRVGNIQVSRNVLDAVFFWCIPKLQNAGSVLTDSWSISSIALNISRLLCRYDPNVKLEDFHVNMLTTHFDGSKKFDPELAHNLFAIRNENDKEILLLISAVKTLKSLENIKKIFAGLNPDNSLSCVAIYQLIKTDNIDALCDLSGDFETQQGLKFDSYPTAGDESVIEIVGKVFFPLELKETEVWMRKYCTTKNEAFFRKYEGKDVLYIHRNSYYFNKGDKFRHHGIYVDVSKMLLCSSFRRGVNMEVEKMDTCPALIIYPPHDHGRDMVDAINADLEKKFGKSVDSHSVLDFDFLTRPINDPLIKTLSTLQQDDVILIVDDVSTSGTRLKNYQRSLRYVYKGRIHYFIGVARPEKEAIWAKRVADLVYRQPGLAKHTVTCVEKVFLPDWDEKNCPWCSEKEIVGKVASKPVNKTFPLTRQLKSRFFKLQSGMEEGLQNDVFLSINEQPKPVFQGGSIFAESTNISESDLVGIVAASIQSIRNEGGEDDGRSKISLQTEYPHFKILRIEDYMGERASFNEALVKAAILRCATHIELHAKDEPNRQKQVREVGNFLSFSSVGEHEIGFFIYELYLALKMRKLPKPETEKKLIQFVEDALRFRPGSNS